MKSKEQKRTEALERQAAYNALSLQDKVRLCERRRGSSRRELTKLLDQIEAQQEAENAKANKAA
jgi:hypothetical protein